MNLKDPRKIIRNLFEKHTEKKDNIVYAHKLFIINSIVNYLFKDKYYTEIDKNKLLEYGALITRYLEDEVDIYWQDGILMVDDRYGTPRPSEV